MIADVTGVLFTLLWWGMWGPTAATNRFVAALTQRAPSVAADSLDEALDQLQAHLETLGPAEQRRLVYEVTRDTFAAADGVWNEVAALALDEFAVKGGWMVPTDDALARLFAGDDEQAWAVIVHAAIVSAQRSPDRQLGEKARRVHRVFPTIASGDTARRALVELLAPEGPTFTPYVRRAQPTPEGSAS